MDRRSRLTFKDIVLERLITNNSRTDLPNYWGFIVVGAILIMLPVVESGETLAALSLWRKGAPMDTLTPSGKIGRVVPLHDALWSSFAMIVTFAVAISMLIIGIAVHTVCCRRRRACDAADVQ
jgi:uncharacterized membrane protein YhaH (DUF805 family)